jgi:hypothetical protein
VVDTVTTHRRNDSLRRTVSIASAHAACWPPDS